MFKLFHKKDLVYLTLLQLATYVFLLLVRPTHLIASALVYFVPVVFLLNKVKNDRAKVAVFSAIAAFWMFGVIDVIAVAGNAWRVQQSIPVRYLGISYYENIIWSFGFSMWALLVYKHFVQVDRPRRLSKHWKLLVLILVAYNSVLYLVYALNRSLLIIPYPYLFVGIFLMMPFFIILTRHNPQLLVRSLPVSLYLLVNSLLYELVAVYIGNWWFPGPAIGSMRFLSVEFPLEELVFWIILSAPTLIEVYEYFIDEN